MRRLLSLTVCCGVLAAPSAALAGDGDVIVRFRADAGAAERADARLTADVRREQDLRLAQLELVAPEPGVTAEQAIAALERDEDVVRAEPDRRRRALVVPGDPLFGTQWGLQNTGQVVEGTAGTAGADIRATEAWDTTIGSPSVLVAVVDTGIALAHPDLVANLWTDPGEIAGNGVDDDGSGFADDVRGHDFVDGDNLPEDQNGHGTHVSGTVAARGDNGQGVTGVAWTTSILPVRALDALGGGFVSDLVLAYGYAARQGADIVNLSLGGAGASAAEFDAIAAAPQVLFVAAAGNDGADNDVVGSFPCEYDLPNVICVAASDQDDQLAIFSNFGDQSVDLAAPGVTILSTFTGAGGFAVESGTSMSTPHVSGVAALLLAAHPPATVAELRASLLDTVAPKPAFATTTVSGGRLDAAAAVADIFVPPPPPPPPPPAPDPVATAPVTPAPAVTVVGSRTAPDRTGPGLDLALTPRRDLGAFLRRGLRVRVRCTEACALTAEARRGRRRLARRTARRTSAGTTTLTLRLSRAERRRLRRSRSVLVTLRITAVDAAGNRSSETVRLRLRGR
jgi:thermitase